MIEKDTLNTAINRLKVLKHPKPTAILKLLINNGEKNVSEIQQAFPKLAQPEVSLALAELRKANLVMTRKQGRFVFYEPNYSELENLEIQIKAIA